MYYFFKIFKEKNRIFVKNKPQSSHKLLSIFRYNILSHIFIQIAFQATEEKLLQLFIIHQRSDFIIHYSLKIRFMSNE